MRHFIVFIISIMLSNLAFSNGGPIVNSKVIKTGQIQLINERGINIIDEKINIKIDGEYSIYDITYTLQNEYFFDIDTVTYGFPVDYLNNFYSGDRGSMNKDIPYFEMYLDDKLLNMDEHFDYTTLHDSLLIKNGEHYNSLYSNFSYDYKRKWFITQLIFYSKKTYELKVKYKIRNYSVDFVTSKSTFISYDTRKLLYDFSPASYWGDGIIGKISINIDVSNIDTNQETHVLKGLEGYSFKNGIYSFQQEKFDPNINKFLLLNYSFTSRGKTNDIIQNHILMDNSFSIKSSPSNGKINNFYDLDPSTSYSLKKGSSNSCFIILKNG